MNKAVGNNIFNLSSVEVKLEDRSVHCCLWNLETLGGLYMKIIYVLCGEETGISDPRSYGHYRTSS